MSLTYLFNACAAFEKTAGFSLDLESAKAKANSLIQDMGVEEACAILNVSPDVTDDLLEIALKSKLIELRQEKSFGTSKQLANKQHAIIKAFSVLEPIAFQNSESTYEFDGTEEYPDQEKVVMDLGAMASRFEKLANGLDHDKVARAISSLEALVSLSFTEIFGGITSTIGNWFSSDKQKETNSQQEITWNKTRTLANELQSYLQKLSSSNNYDELAFLIKKINSFLSIANIPVMAGSAHQSLLLQTKEALSSIKENIRSLLLVKQAQTKPIVLDPKKKNKDFWSKFLFNAVKSYAAFLPSPKDAQRIFEAIKAHKQSPAYNADAELRQLDQILGALEECELKLGELRLDPLEVLKNSGMQNIHPNAINLMKSNLETLKAGVNFANYQHYYLLSPGEAHPKDVIELDTNKDAGY